MTTLNKTKMALACLALLVTTALLWFKIILNSDSLFLDGLATDIFTLGGNWSDWRLSPAPAYFPDMLLYFLAYKVLPNPTLRIFCVSAAQVLILALTTVWVSKQIYAKISAGALATQCLLIAFVTLVASQSGMWLYFYSTNNHFASLLGSLLSLGLLIRFYNTPSWLLASGIALLGGVCVASTVTYCIAFLAPACVVLIIVRTMGFDRKKIHRMLGILSASYLASVCMNALLTYNHPLTGRIPHTLEAAKNAFRFFLEATRHAFSWHFSENYGLTFIFSVLVATCLAWLLKQKNDGDRDGDWRWVISATLLWCATPINIAGAIISGGLYDTAGYRYFSFPIALILLLTVIKIDKKSHTKNTIKKWNTAYFAIGLFIIGFSVYAFNKNIQRPKQYDNNVSVAACLIEIEHAGFHLESGMGDYWNSRGVTEYLPHKNWIITMQQSMQPYFWMATNGPVRRLDHYRYYYNFAILHTLEDPAGEHYTSETIGKLLPKPSAIHHCADMKTDIWLYKNNALDQIIKQTFQQLAD